MQPCPTMTQSWSWWSCMAEWHDRKIWYSTYTLITPGQSTSDFRMREDGHIFYLTSVILAFCYSWLSLFLINTLVCVEGETLRIKRREQRLLTQNTEIFSSTRSQEGTEDCPLQASKEWGMVYLWGWNLGSLTIVFVLGTKKPLNSVCLIY